MRGNHHFLGRQDYVQALPMPEHRRELVFQCQVSPRNPEKALPWHWHEVRVNGRVVGHVTTRLAGQQYRLLDSDVWLPAQEQGHELDPPHGHAILMLLDAIGAIGGEQPTFESFS